MFITIDTSPPAPRPPKGGAAARELRQLPAGQLLCAAATTGPVWRVRHGMLRLDRQDARGPEFALLALPGDLVGLETLLGNPYHYSARALLPCVLEPLEPADEPQRQQLLGRGLIQLQQRTGEMLALRTGPVVQRLQRLLAMLSSAHGGAEAPPRPRLKDIAAIVDATQERTCRLLGEMRAAIGAPGRASAGRAAALRA